MFFFLLFCYIEGNVTLKFGEEFTFYFSFVFLFFFSIFHFFFVFIIFVLRIIKGMNVASIISNVASYKNVVV